MSKIAVPLTIGGAALLIGVLPGQSQALRYQTPPLCSYAAEGDRVCIDDQDLVNSQTGAGMTLTLVAEETAAGLPGVVALNGTGAYSLCSGIPIPWEAWVNFADDPPFYGGDLIQYSCGGIHHQRVVIEECKAHIESSGFLSMYDPEPLIYAGPVGIDLDLKKARNGGTATFDLTLHTPRGEVSYTGSLDGIIEWDACP